MNCLAAFLALDGVKGPEARAEVVRS